MNEEFMAWNTDKELAGWILNAEEHGGSFVKAVANAAMWADSDNYRLMRPWLMKLRAKVPEIYRGDQPFSGETGVMTVKELIEKLQALPQDKDVKINGSFGWYDIRSVKHKDGVYYVELVVEES